MRTSCVYTRVVYVAFGGLFVSVGDPLRAKISNYEQVQSGKLNCRNFEPRDVEVCEQKNIALLFSFLTNFFTIFYRQILSFMEVSPAVSGGSGVHLPANSEFLVQVIELVYIIMLLNRTVFFRGFRLGRLHRSLRTKTTQTLSFYFFFLRTMKY